MVLREEITVPAGVEVRLDRNSVEVSGPKGKLQRTFGFRGVSLRSEDRRIIVESASPKRRSKAAVGTVKAHFRNMFKGVTAGFLYRMKVVYSHFPITVKVEGKNVLVQNFIGERFPRKAKIVGGAEVEVDGDQILIRGADKEDVGQTAINIEKSTTVRGLDRRVFQDGCYLVGKE